MLNIYLGFRQKNSGNNHAQMRWIKKAMSCEPKGGKIQQKYDFCLRTRNHEETCGLNIVYYFPLP